MTTTYSNGRTIYTFQANGPILFGGFSVAVDATSAFGYAEADLDAAVEAFTDSLNASGHAHIDKVVKVFEAAGTSDWTYES